MMFQEIYGGPGFVRAAKQGVYDGIGLPYKGGTFRALALLPDGSATFDDIVQDLAAGAQVRWVHYGHAASCGGAGVLMEIATTNRSPNRCLGIGPRPFTDLLAFVSASKVSASWTNSRIFTEMT